MSDNDIWYGFLQASDKSSPVVRDSGLRTNNSKTIYLFNHARGQIVEYSREIVEQKLRELKPDDVSLAELKRAFKAARKKFVATRVTRIRETAPETVTAMRGAVSGRSRLIDSKGDLPENDVEDAIGDDAYG
jgi:hypothetical protein